MKGIRELIEASRDWEARGIPTHGLGARGELTTSWSDTLTAVKRALGKDWLDPVEVTLVSISRDYGVMPALQPETWAALRAWLWGGTAVGTAYGWGTLANQMEAFITRGERK